MNSFEDGVWAATATPMDSRLNIDTEKLIQHVKNLLNQGCNGVALFGTTGEANSFSISEKLKALTSIADIKLDSNTLMVGTGCCAVSDTIDFTLAAIDMGYRNFLLLPPFYYKGMSEQGIFNAYSHVLASLPKEGISVIVYDIPQMTGVEISLDLLIRLQRAFPDVVKGVKNSTGNWDAMKATCDAMPGFGVFAGTEQYLLPTLKAGGAGCISATANVTSAKLGEIYANRDAPNAEALQKTATETRLTLQKFPPAAALKQILSHFYNDNDWRNLRPPWVNLSGEQSGNLFKALRETGANLNAEIS